MIAFAHQQLKWVASQAFWAYVLEHSPKRSSAYGSNSEQKAASEAAANLETKRTIRDFPEALLSGSQIDKNSKLMLPYIQSFSLKEWQKYVGEIEIIELSEGRDDLIKGL